MEPTGSNTTTAVSAGRNAAYASRFLSISAQRAHSRSRSAPWARRARNWRTPSRVRTVASGCACRFSHPGRLGRTPTVHGHRDEPVAVLEVAQDDPSRASAASPGCAEPECAPAGWLRPPQSQPASGRSQQRAVRVPEPDDEPAWLQAGAPTGACSPPGAGAPPCAAAAGSPPAAGSVCVGSAPGIAPGAGPDVIAACSASISVEGGSLLATSSSCAASF